MEHLIRATLQVAAELEPQLERRTRALQDKAAELKKKYLDAKSAADVASASLDRLAEFPLALRANAGEKGIQILCPGCFILRNERVLMRDVGGDGSTDRLGCPSCGHGVSAGI